LKETSNNDITLLCFSIIDTLCRKSLAVRNFLLTSANGLKIIHLSYDSSKRNEKCQVKRAYCHCLEAFTTFDFGLKSDPIFVEL